MSSMQSYQPTQAAEAYVANVVRRHLKVQSVEMSSATVRRLPRPVDSPAA
ncbi:MAG: hypothetical protein JNM84_14835 [Planctomycetes bacterium]|nr:hypothetical protein [Planctomycetota bacterium]